MNWNRVKTNPEISSKARAAIIKGTAADQSAQASPFQELWALSAKIRKVSHWSKTHLSWVANQKPISAPKSTKETSLNQSPTKVSQTISKPTTTVKLPLDQSWASRTQSTSSRERQATTTTRLTWEQALSKTRSRRQLSPQMHTWYLRTWSRIPRTCQTDCLERLLMVHKANKKASVRWAITWELGPTSKTKPTE